jgi:hypothetical protein
VPVGGNVMTYDSAVKFMEDCQKTMLGKINKTRDREVMFQEMENAFRRLHDEQDLDVVDIKTYNNDEDLTVISFKVDEISGSVDDILENNVVNTTSLDRVDGKYLITVIVDIGVLKVVTDNYHASFREIE